MKNELIIKYERLDHWQDLNEEDQALVIEAQSICDDAYAPYSNFKVGSSLRMSDGSIINGNNQENIAFPSGLCAERVALFYANANYSDKKVMTLCVVAKGDLLPKGKLLSPCGSCRQVMVETEKRQSDSIKVIIVNQNDVTLVFGSARDLLPLSFSNE